MPALVDGGRRYRPLVLRCRWGWPESAGMGGRLPPEWVAGFRRNQWPISAGPSTASTESSDSAHLPGWLETQQVPVQLGVAHCQIMPPAARSRPPYPLRSRMTQI